MKCKLMKNVNADNKRIIELLKDYFDEREDIVFAFLFGSAARGKVRREGDIDVAIYFRPEKDVEWENFSKPYKGENRIALDLERLLKKEIDLVVLNRARSVLADEIIRKGKPIIIRDRGIFMNFFCIVSDEAEYVRDWLTYSYKEKKVASGR
jgi:predicted nucleotidyltransferase